jgi:hypothetical protein
MFGLFKNKTPSSSEINQKRRNIIDFFEKSINDLRNANPAVQKVVGHSINMANTAFINQYSSREHFLQLPNSERNQYIIKLNEFEKMTLEKDPLLSLGFALFKAWLVFYIEKDFEIADRFAKDLDYFSRMSP